MGLRSNFEILKRQFNIFTKGLKKNNSEIMLSQCTGIKYIRKYNLTSILRFFPQGSHNKTNTQIQTLY